MRAAYTTASGCGSVLEQCPDEAWRQRCQAWLQTLHRAALLQQAAQAAKEATRKQSTREKEDFLAWIVGAEKAHLGPVYKAIKGHEQTTLRPYRDKSLMCWAYLRMGWQQKRRRRRPVLQSGQEPH